MFYSFSVVSTSYMCFMDLINYRGKFLCCCTQVFSRLTSGKEIENACIDCADLRKRTRICDAYDLKPNLRNISSRSELWLQNFSDLFLCLQYLAFIRPIKIVFLFWRDGNLHLSEIYIKRKRTNMQKVNEKSRSWRAGWKIFHAQSQHFYME